MLLYFSRRKRKSTIFCLKYHDWTNVCSQFLRRSGNATDTHALVWHMREDPCLSIVLRCLSKAFLLRYTSSSLTKYRANNVKYEESSGKALDTCSVSSAWRTSGISMKANAFVEEFQEVRTLTSKRV